MFARAGASVVLSGRRENLLRELAGSLTAEGFNDTSSELKGTLTLSPNGMSRPFRIPAGGKRSFDFPWNNRTSLTA